MPYAGQLGNKSRSAQGPNKPASSAELFRHAQPWRFARPDDGRKFRIVRERERRLARCLSRFDRSGNCAEIFPAISTILDRLRDSELNYPEAQRFTWSRRTVLMYLGRLKRSGIATTNGLSHYHGTRRRVLHSNRLLFAPLESCTPTRRESCTRSKAFKSLKVHGNASAEAPAAAKVAARSASTFSCAELRRPEKAVELLNGICERHPCLGFVWAAELLAWALRNSDRRISSPHKYVMTCVDNFLQRYPDYQQKAILQRFSDDLPDVYFDGERWREPSDQDRCRLKLLHSIVEEAARLGVPARELSLERFAKKGGVF